MALARQTGGGPATARPCAGFTLLELMLAILLVALLASVSYFSVASLKGGAEFEEAADRFESLLRMARADAARKGLRVRIAVDANSGAAQILCQTDPAGDPEQFDIYPSCPWVDFVPGNTVRVTRLELTSPTYRIEQPETPKSGTPAFDAVTFRPDGSSDSAVVELSPSDAGDLRRAVIQLDGANGIITTNMVQADELDAFYGSIGLAGGSAGGVNGNP